jgi:predicted GIY-YIG superfamily endonuclease
MYKGFLYKITCKVTNCVYIGITTKTIKRRFSQHFRTAYREDSGMYHTYLYRSIRKYGIENFEINEL